MAVVMNTETYLKNKYQDFKSKHNVLVDRLVSRRLPWYRRYGFRWYLLLLVLLLSRVPIFNIFLVPIALIAVLPFLLYEKIDRESAQIRYEIRQLGNETLKWRRGFVGEEKVFHELLKLPDDYYIFNDITVNDHQIDHIVISPKGVLAIETKNFVGSYTHINDEAWQSRKGMIRSPQKQARANAEALANRLNSKVFPVVVMAGSATVKGIAGSSVAVIHVSRLLHVIWNLPDIFTADQVKELVQNLK